MKPERKSFVILSIFTGIACICMSYLLFFAGSVEAQSSDDYAGIQDCGDCHPRIERYFETTAHALTFLAIDENSEAIIGDFTVGDDVRMYTFPDEDAPRPFTGEDIAFVVGTGQVAQRYVVDAGEGDYRVLPAEWNVEAGEWQTFSLPDGDDSWGNCATCHTTGYDTESHQWVDNGASCESCHGPGFAHVEAADGAGGRIDDEEQKTILATIIRNPEPETCGNCHTQWSTEETCDDPIHCTDSIYETWSHSPHAQLVADEDNPENTDFAMACEGCHNAHAEDQEFPNLLSISPDDACLVCHDTNASDLMSGATIVENVVGSPSAHYEEGLTCESCHDPHGVSAIPTDLTLNTTCTNCHSDLTQTAIRDFADGAQEKVRTRLDQVELVIDDTAPEWVTTVVTTIRNDGSDGIHNLAYVLQMLDAAELELGIRTTQSMSAVPLVTASDPTDCAECHADIHETWQHSPHANASLGDTFQEAYAANGQPSYCMTCHASGYDPETQTYVFEGVVCSTCHTVEGNEHPPSPMAVDNASASCGRCHSGEHSPEYNEWLVSEHSTFDVDCVDCHVAHDNGLRLDDVNATCSDCHADAMEDEIHMGEDMTCVDCHMTRITDDDGHVIHHTMYPEPRTCADCHGDIHTLEKELTQGLTDVEQEVVTSMEEEIATLTDKAETNLQSGIVGGAVGALVLIGLLLIVLRIGRMR